jgi:hypothetical protein
MLLREVLMLDLATDARASSPLQVGSILIALNPFTLIPELFGQTIMDSYVQV